MSTNLQTHAIVLHKFPYGDKDLIIRLLTADGEVISAFAKGGQNSAKRFGPVLDVFNQVEITATQRPHSSMLNLQGAQLLLPMDAVRLDLIKYAACSFFAEMFLVFLKEGEKLPELYRDFQSFLLQLNQLESFDENALPAWEYKWLHHLGFKPELSQCVTCGDTCGDNGGDNCVDRATQEKFYHFSEKSGGILCQPCQKSELWGGKSKMLSYQAIQGLLQNVMPSHLNHVRNLRQTLESFIEYTAGKSLKSLQFLNQVLL